MTENSLSWDELLQLHPADLADWLQRLPAEEAHELFQRLPRKTAADVLAELDDEKSRELLIALPSAELVELFGFLQPNIVADLAFDLPTEQRREILTALPAEKADAVTELLRYPPDTAGGLMSDRFITLHPDQTLQSAQDRLRRRAIHKNDDISYLYVTEERRRLIGIISLRDLVFGDPNRKISDAMNRDVKFLRVDDDQEEIARQFEHYHYMGLPVTDLQGRLVGIVKASDILHVAQAEATEDMQLMVGLSGEERALTPWHKAVGRRLPWLYVNLATAVLAAAVVGFFEETIAQWTALAIFLPIVAGQGGNAGMQTLTVIIRDMALGELSSGDGRKALTKELALGLVNGLAVGLVVGLIGLIWKGSAALGLVAGLAMLLNQMAAALSGVLIPFGLKFFKVDPALAASIFVTTVTDVAGFFFFLGLAALALSWFM